MDEIIYTTPSKQIEKLKSQNLQIEDEEYAKDSLSTYGYSNLIKSYREPYIITTEKGKIYRSGVTFEQITSLYILDKNLRNGVMAAMLDLEEHIKELAADVIANAFGTHPDAYLKYRNYRNKRKRKHRFTLTGILETMRTTLDTDKDPIHHYATEHSIVPPWILFKSIYFSTIINFIDQFKEKEQNELVHRLYDLDNLQITETEARKMLMDTLYVCLQYRNAAAHGGRIYNLSSLRRLELDDLPIVGANKNHSGFDQLLTVLNLLEYRSPFLRLRDVLDEEINRHCNKFVQDVTYLGQTLNVNIISQNLVYVPNSSNTYHLNPYCSGIKYARPLELNEAKKLGYVPCKRCVNEIT